MITVTSYRNPDLDGVACSIAYTELLLKLGKEARATYFGQTGLEVDFVKDYSGGFPIEAKNDGYSENDRFVLVDTADSDAIDPSISPDQVIEIYDHRKLIFLENFKNAKSKIEQVGSCATLIAEQFKKHNLEPSKIASLYLYGAIVSNTINFKNTTTTKRDKAAAKWLKTFLNLPNNFTEKMFLSKSKVNSSNFKGVIEQDFAVKTVKGKKVGIAQMEIAKLDIFINANKIKLEKFFEYLKKQRSLDYFLFTGIDILEGFNRFITVDQKSEKLFSKALGVKDKMRDIKVGYITMRKQIWPKLDAVIV